VKRHLDEIGEWALIDIVRRKFPGRRRGVFVGMGDDAAVLQQNKGRKLLATTDSLVEGVHFDLSYTSPYYLGRKAVAVNLSDIAAMGGIAKYALLSLALPGGLSKDFFNEFLRGVKSISSEQGVILVGGNTSSSRNGIFVSLAILGEAKVIVQRCGARDGDSIFVTGTLGDSALGLEIAKKARDPSLATLIGMEKALALRHLNPAPRLSEGRALASRKIASAMIDVSDGLLSDLGHIVEESRLGARVCAEKLPLSRALCSLAPSWRKDPIGLALSGGEDYEIIFTASKKDVRRNLARTKGGIRVTEIGVMDSSIQGIEITLDGRPYSAAFRGYEHFMVKGRVKPQ